MSQTEYPVEVLALDADTPHALGTAIDFPHGRENHVVLHFRTPMDVRTAQGHTTAEPGDCLIYRPGTPQWYRGRGVGFRDDWLIARGPGIERWMAAYQLPGDTLLRAAGGAMVATLVSAIQAELLLHQPWHQQAVALRFEELLLRLAQNLAARAEPAAVLVESSQLEVLRAVRLQLHQQMSRPWTLPAMARIAGLSASRFTVLYRRCFGTSPLQDLIAARLGRARWLLATTRLEVGEVARQTGFHDPFHFSRLFRRRTGVSPRHFALRHSEGCRRD